MRCSICACEPSIAYAGDSSTWKFSYTTAAILPKGTRLRFDLLSKGKEADWQIPQTSLKQSANLIWAEDPKGKILEAKAVTLPGKTTPVFEFILPEEVKVGEAVCIFLGAKAKEDKHKKGTRAQTLSQRRRAFHLYIDPKGKGAFKDPEVFQVDVKGNTLHAIRAVAPSIVVRNKRFDVLLRFEDRFGNLTSNAPQGTLIELSYEYLRENLSWKLFIPETGFLNVPNLYFNETGLYKIQLHNLRTGEKFFSDPIKCLADWDKNLYWGLLHGESPKFDSKENIEGTLRYFRDELFLSFYATSAYEGSEEISNEEWKHLSHQVAAFNEDHRFTTFLGFQWWGTPLEEGVHQFIYAKDNKPLLRKKDLKSGALKKIYRGHSPKELLSIPCFSMGKGRENSFTEFNPEFERVVEIYNIWGSSECSSKEENPRPILPLTKKGLAEIEKGSIQSALNRNCRFGFVAGGLDHQGPYGGLTAKEQTRYSPGLTAIIAVEQTRESLIQALTSRSCYATTGEKIILNFSVAGSPMGSELSTKLKPGLTLNRHITGYVAGTTTIKEITLFRNGKKVHEIHPASAYFDLTWDDMTPIKQLLLPSSDGRPPFIYYYLRVIQEDGHIAWSSPIWIDYVEGPAVSSLPRKKKTLNKPMGKPKKSSGESLTKLSRKKLAAEK